jgi:radical SAM-linked protein
MSYIYRTKYKKNGSLKFISHLDLNALFRRTLGRTKMPVELTQGYNPRFKVSFGPALPLGIAGWQEILDFFLTKELDTEQIKSKINKVAPAGLTITEVEEVHEQGISLSQSLQSAVYLISLGLKEIRGEKMTGEWEGLISSRVHTFLGKKNIMVEKKTKKGVKKVDLRPYIQKLASVSRKDNNIFFHLVVDIQYRGSINPRLIMNAFLNEWENGSIYIKEIIREKLILTTDGKD